MVRLYRKERRRKAVPESVTFTGQEGKASLEEGGGKDRLPRALVSCQVDFRLCVPHFRCEGRVEALLLFPFHPLRLPLRQSIKQH